jgi:hypothetical protein
MTRAGRGAGRGATSPAVPSFGIEPTGIGAAAACIVSCVSRVSCIAVAAWPLRNASAGGRSTRDRAEHGCGPAGTGGER